MRTTDADVMGVVEVDASIPLLPFITIANQLVTECCLESGYTDERLALIETWLAAHFYLMRDSAVASEKAGSVSVNYQYKIGMMLQQTKHGQTAMMLDTAGNLARLSKQLEEGRSNVSIGWLGENYSTEEGN